MIRSVSRRIHPRKRPAKRIHWYSIAIAPPVTRTPPSSPSQVRHIEPVGATPRPPPVGVGAAGGITPRDLRGRRIGFAFAAAGDTPDRGDFAGPCSRSQRLAANSATRLLDRRGSFMPRFPPIAGATSFRPGMAGLAGDPPTASRDPRAPELRAGGPSRSHTPPRPRH